MSHGVRLFISRSGGFPCRISDAGVAIFLAVAAIDILGYPVSRSARPAFRRGRGIVENTIPAFSTIASAWQPTELGEPGGYPCYESICSQLARAVEDKTP